MRIAVDCRFLALGRGLLHRGIPRYTQQQLKAVLALDTANDYLLLHPSNARPTELLPEIHQAPNVSFQPFPGWVPSHTPDRSLTLRQTEQLEQLLTRERVALYHGTLPWLYVAPIYPAIDACPVVNTVYDLIPSLFPEHLPGGMRDAWLLALEQLRRSTRLLAISRHTRHDAHLHLQVPHDRIDIAYPHAEPWFQPIEPAAIESRLASLRRRLSFNGRFVMAVSFPGFRNKNLEALLAGYARVPASLRRSMPLVIVGHLGPSPHMVRDTAVASGIDGDVLTTGVVSEDQLVALYNAATMFVCPSRYEGFGMPVVEAMACGTPVITTTSSSLPEVAGDAARLVHPDAVDDIAAAIEEIAGDPALHARMRAAGLERARAFTSEALGRATIDCYQRALSMPADPVTRPVAAVCAVVPGRPDLAARQGLDLAEGLSATHDVELFVAGDTLPTNDVMRRYRVRHETALPRRLSECRYDAVFVMPGAESMAGAAARHAASATIAGGNLPADRWGDLLAGSRSVIVPPGTAVPEPGAASGHPRATPVVHALLPGVADPLGEREELQVQQSRAALGIPAEAFVVCWPEPVDTPAEIAIVLSAFAALLREAPLSLLYVGHPGSPVPSIPPQVHATAKVSGVLERVRPMSGPDAIDTETCLVACDVVVALAAADTAPSPMPLIRGCAAGKPIIASQHDAWSWLPSGAVWRMPPGVEALTAFRAALCSLGIDPVHRHSLAREARRFYDSELTPRAMAVRYLPAVGAAPAPSRQDVVAAPAAPAVSRLGFNKPCEIEDFADPDLVSVIRDVMAYKLPHFPAFPEGHEHCKDWEVAMAIRTLRDHGALHPQASVLGVAAGMEDTIYYLSRHVREVMVVDRYAQAGIWSLNSPSWMLAAPELGSYAPCDPQRIVVQHMDARVLRFPDDRFDAIFSSGSIEHFGGLMDVAHSACEMGRVLKPGGILSLSTIVAVRDSKDRLGDPGMMLAFRREHLERYIIDASGLELVDDLQTDVSDATYGVRRPLDATMVGNHLRGAAHGLKGQHQDFLHAECPMLIYDWAGVTFDSIHLALRKPDRSRVALNDWAKPTERVKRDVLSDTRRLVAERQGWLPDDNAPAVSVAHEQDGRRAAQQRAVQRQRHLASALLSEIAGVISESARIHGERPDDARAWVTIDVQRPGLPAFGVVVDPDERRDIVSRAYLAGAGPVLNTAELDWLCHFVAPGDVVCDVGAHVGSITLPLAARGCRVLAVEASAKNAALLRAGVMRNGFRDVHVVHAAAGASTGGSVGFLADGAWGWVVAPGEPNSEASPLVRVDDLVDVLGWGPVRLAKVDVEGFELDVFKGMTRLLEGPDAPVLFYESNTHTLNHRGELAGAIVRYLETFGYRCYATAPGKLRRVRPGEHQTEILIDVLATRDPLPALPGIRIDEDTKGS